MQLSAFGYGLGRYDLDKPGAGSRVVGCCDIDADVLPQAREWYGDDVFFSPDYRELLAQDIDAVFVTTPDYLHEERWASANLVEERLVFESEEFRENKVPDVRGMKARDAVYLLENMGLKTQLSGRGKVKSQSIRAGQEIKKGQKINLQLAAY